MFIPAHCLLHREALCGKRVKHGNVMETVIKITNFIRSNALKHRQFKEFLQSLDMQHTDIPYHCEIRWLSRGKVLARFF